MKKILYFSAIMLTTHTVVAASIDPCGDLSGMWYGLQRRFSDMHVVSGEAEHILQERVVYLEINSTPMGTLRLLGACIDGDLEAV